jgi:hypothetical protein
VSRVCVTFDERGDVVEYELGPSNEACNEGWKAMMLAKDLATCRALLRGETVPIDHLRGEWIARFGLKPSVSLTGERA